MKPDDYIPRSLLDMRLPLPVETHGLGGFRPYDGTLRAQVVVHNPKHLPRRQSTCAAGFDLVTTKDVSVPARGSTIVDTGVALALPPGHYGRIAGRSSLAFKHDVTAFEGTIDEDYRGPVKVKLFNHSDETFEATALTRIAQLIVQPVVTPQWDMVDVLADTERGDGGFGSTGTI